MRELPAPDALASIHQPALDPFSRQFERDLKAPIHHFDVSTIAVLGHDGHRHQADLAVTHEAQAGPVDGGFRERVHGQNRGCGGGFTVGCVVQRASLKCAIETL